MRCIWLQEHQSFASLQSKGIPQGATIVKLVTTQSGAGKPTAIITTTQSGQTPSTILGISSVQPQIRAQVRMASSTLQQKVNVYKA